ncbi:neuromedin-U receptor 2-like [Mya arenaria]|uniref:neuromedin-U receptor 2-like n=1 Tax=Mya arenaria TaxID=6604 RepID=UPI0022E3802B|nr:neuromedin-U receptor 2-like [Mya arenaria]
MSRMPPPGCAPYEEYPDPYSETVKYLWKIIPLVVVIIGLCGNILTVIILLRQRRKTSSTALFLFTLAISDTITLLSSPIRNWLLRGIEEKDVRNMSELGCKFSNFFTYASVQFSSWILVGVTCERLISVVWPHRVRLGCTPRAAIVTIFALLIPILGLNAHMFYGHGNSSLVPRDGPCEPLYIGYSKFWDKYWPWIDFAVAYAVPFLFLAVSNTVIIYKMHKTHRQRRRISSVGKHGVDNSARDKKLVTIVLVILTVSFFICLTPVQIFFIYQPYWRERVFEEYFCQDWKRFAEETGKFQLVFAIVNLLSYINAGFNFFLYVISGSKFRHEVKALFMCTPSGDAVFGSSTSSSARRHLTHATSVQSRLSSQNSLSRSSDDAVKGHNIDVQHAKNCRSEVKTSAPEDVVVDYGVQNKGFDVNDSFNTKL